MNRMNKFKIFFVCTALFFLERVFFTRFEIFGLVPWLLFSFVMAGAATKEELGTYPVFAGVCGLAVDLAGGGATGVGMILYALAAGGVFLLSRCVLREGFLTSALAVFIFSLAAESLYCIMNYAKANPEILSVFIRIILPLAVINTVFALVLSPIAKRLFGQRRIIF